MMPAEHYFHQLDKTGDCKAAHGNRENGIANPERVNKQTSGADREDRVLFPFRLQKNAVDDHNGA